MQQQMNLHKTDAQLDNQGRTKDLLEMHKTEKGTATEAATK